MNVYKDITLILVAYRSELLILKNLNVLKKFPTVIVDNSNSEKLELILKKYENIKLIRSSKNLGFGKANNLAVSVSNTPFILIISPDIIISENSIVSMFLEFYKDSDNIGILGPSLYDDKMNRRTNGSKSFISQLKGNKVSKNINNIPVDNICCEFLMGCCYLMKRDFFNYLNGFDNSFFMYFEDCDLCDRTIQNGKYIMEVPTAKMIHLENSSSKKNLFSNSKLALIHKISNYIYLQKNLSKKYLLIQLIKNFIEYFFRIFINFFLLRFKKSYKNLLRVISIILYISSMYKIIYN